MSSNKKNTRIFKKREASTDISACGLLKKYDDINFFPFFATQWNLKKHFLDFKKDEKRNKFFPPQPGVELTPSLFSSQRALSPRATRCPPPPPPPVLTAAAPARPLSRPLTPMPSWDAILQRHLGFCSQPITSRVQI